MPIGIQLLQHTIYRYLGPVWVDDIDPRLDHYRGPVWVIQIEITVSYSDSTFGYIQFFPVSTSNFYAGMKHKSK